jgi:hypothetical protein
MQTLPQLLENPKQRAHFLRDCVQIIDEEARQKTGFSGLAIKNGYRVLTKVHPAAIYLAMDHLVDDFAKQVEPHCREYDIHKPNCSLAEFLCARSEVLAESLLEATDEKARSFDSSPLMAVYKALRPQAKKHVEQAVPKIAFALERHLSAKEKLVTPAGIEPASAT